MLRNESVSSPGTTRDRRPNGEDADPAYIATKGIISCRKRACGMVTMKRRIRQEKQSIVEEGYVNSAS